MIPNTVVGAPLSGTEPLIAAYGLAPITQTTQDPDGIRGATRYLQGEHGSLLDPSDFPLATVEMQGEMASMTASGGACGDSRKRQFSTEYQRITATLPGRFGGGRFRHVGDRGALRCTGRGRKNRIR